MERLGLDPQAVNERFAWQFADLDWKKKRLREDLEQQVTPAACKQSLSALEKSEEKLNILMGEKLSALDETSHLETTERLTRVRDEVDQMRREALSFIQVKETEDKAGGLPTGVLVPEFHGDPNKFPDWFESFEALVHQNVKVSQFCKYRYLRQALKGSAASCLDGFSPLVEHYGFARSKLGLVSQEK